jgi:hypothetical protein
MGGEPRVRGALAAKIESYYSNCRKTVRGVQEAIASASGLPLVALGAYLGKRLYAMRHEMDRPTAGSAKFSAGRSAAVSISLRKNQ